MKRIYTYGHEQVQRNITIGDIIENKKNGLKMTQVTAQNKEEAEILSDQNIDMIITGSDAYEDVRSGAPNTFITAALFAGRFITKDDILKGAIEVAMKGADSVLTPRSPEIVEMLAHEGMHVQGHVGMVPSNATKFGGIRTVGKTVLIPPNNVAFEGTIPTCPCTCNPSLASISTISGLLGVNTESAPFIATSIAPFKISSFVTNLPANNAAVINVFGAPCLTSSYVSLPVMIISIF